MTRTILFACITTILLFITGCVQEQPVTDKEALNFAKELESTMEKNDPTIFNNILVNDVFIRRIKEASNGQLSSAMLSKVPESIKEKKLGNEILRSIGEEGMYRLLRKYERDGKQHLLFRLFGNSGINYHDIELVHSGKEIKAADVYIFLTGENISKTLADLFVQFDDLYRTKADMLHFVKSIQEIKRFIREEKYNDARLLFDELPDTIKSQKALQLIHLNIAAGINDSLYDASFRQFKSLFPNDASPFINLLDLHLRHSQYTEALEDINNMDKLINTDPFLDYYRGLIYKAMDKDAEALASFERLNRNVPFGNGLLEMIALYIKKGDKQKAKTLIDVYRSNKTYNQHTLDLVLQLYPLQEN